MKKRREMLFKDNDILIPIENGARDKHLTIWTHISEYKKKRKKVIVKVARTINFGKPTNLNNKINLELDANDCKNVVQVAGKNVEYIQSSSTKSLIKLFFKRKRRPAEDVLLALNDFVASILRYRKFIKTILYKGIYIPPLMALFNNRKRERLSALGPFASSRLGTFIFRASTNLVGLLLIPPFRMLDRRFYITDIPNVERLGHAVANIDVLQAEFSEGMYKTKGEKRTLLVFYPKISFIEDIGYVYFQKINFIRHLSKFLRRNDIRIIYIHPWLERALKRGLVKSGSNFIFPKPFGHRDIFNVLCKTPSLFSLPRNEEKRCIKYFEEKNFKMDRPLVLLSNRSSGNINLNKSGSCSLSEDKRYGYRNSQFDSLVPSIQGLLGKGYNVIKVGSSTGSTGLSSDRFFDFSARPDSEKNILLDLFLFSRSLFFIGDTSGNYSLAQAFRKPICFVNFAPFGHFHSWDQNSLTIFKNIKNNRTGKLERFSDIMKYAYGYEIHNDKAKKTRNFISNTKKEISETVNEMEARVSGSFYKTDESLQRRFQKLFIPSYLHQSVNARCGDYFLKKYEYLLK